MLHLNKKGPKFFNITVVAISKNPLKFSEEVQHFIKIDNRNGKTMRMIIKSFDITLTNGPLSIVNFSIDATLKNARVLYWLRAL